MKKRLLWDGVLIVSISIIAGTIGGYAFAAYARSVVETVRRPGARLLLGAAAVLLAAGIVASLMPAARALRVDVVEALGSE